MEFMERLFDIQAQYETHLSLTQVDNCDKYLMTSIVLIRLIRFPSK